MRIKTSTAFFAWWRGYLTIRYHARPWSRYSESYFTNSWTI